MTQENVSCQCPLCRGYCHSAMARRHNGYCSSGCAARAIVSNMEIQVGAWKRLPEGHTIPHDFLLKRLEEILDGK